MLLAATAPLLSLHLGSPTLAATPSSTDPVATVNSVLDAIAAKEQISVTETELEAEFKRTAARRGVDPAELREQMVKADGLEALRDEMRLSRALESLIASARVLPSGEPVEVK